MLNPGDLVKSLSSLSPSVKEEEVILNFSNTWIDYFSKATITGISLNASSLDSAKVAMIKNLSGISKEAPKAIQQGIIAFWGAIVVSGPTIWITAPNVITLISPPTTLPAIEALLKVQIVKNITGSNIISDIANVLHGNGGIGATATLQPPGTAPPIMSPII